MPIFLSYLSSFVSAYQVLHHFLVIFIYDTDITFVQSFLFIFVKLTLTLMPSIFLAVDADAVNLFH